MPYAVNAMDPLEQARRLQEAMNARNAMSTALVQQAGVPTGNTDLTRQQADALGFGYLGANPQGTYTVSNAAIQNMQNSGGGNGGGVGGGSAGGGAGSGVGGSTSVSGTTVSNSGVPVNFRTIADMVKGYTDRPSAEGMGFSGIEGRLKSLLDDPESITKSAAYKFRVGQGQEALQRSMAAKGLLGSGNRLMELTKYGQDMASQEYDTQFNRLSGLQKTYMDSDDRRLAGLLGTAQNIYSTDVGAGMDKYRTDVGAVTSRYGIQTGANTAAANQSSAERMAEEERLSRERQNNLNNIYNWSTYRDPLDTNRLY